MNVSLSTLSTWLQFNDEERQVFHDAVGGRNIKDCDVTFREYFDFSLWIQGPYSTWKTLKNHSTPGKLDKLRNFVIFSMKVKKGKPQTFWFLSGGWNNAAPFSLLKYTTKRGSNFENNE